jgi:glycosyltransferase involved in cell wall biosynthesis
MHANEWQTAFSIFYLEDHCPEIATLFTTHATGIGRSIAGNGKPLYDYFEGYNGDQMAAELNMVSKHSVEKQAAHWADCFTTVSYITARECKQLLDKPVDIKTPNGFEPTFVPKGKEFDIKREKARTALRKVAGEKLGGVVPENALLLCISGRLEWKNKGIDAFAEALDKLAQKIYHSTQPEREVIAFVMIPYLDRAPSRKGKVSAVFVPYYLDGHDPLFGMSYYDLLIGMDVTVFPSYYEPWGYTPLESCAFHVPTITTSLAGYGEWAARQKEQGGAVRKDVHAAAGVLFPALRAELYLPLPLYHDDRQVPHDGRRPGEHHGEMAAQRADLEQLCHRLPPHGVQPLHLEQRAGGRGGDHRTYVLLRLDGIRLRAV